MKPSTIRYWKRERENAKIARTIYQLRTNAGLSQRELAARVGTSASAICRLEDADYEETRLQLSPGDLVVLYTDGIVEAMNEKEEIFGFDRLLEVVQGAGSIGAEPLLQEIMDRVGKSIAKIISDEGKVNVWIKNIIVIE